MSIASGSFFPIPALVKCAEEERAILERMKELNSKAVLPFPMAKITLETEAEIQLERLERLYDDARREGTLSPEDEKNFAYAVSLLKSISKRRGIMSRIVGKLAEWRDALCFLRHPSRKPQTAQPEKSPEQ